MSRIYTFEFQGTRDKFLKTLSQYPNSNHRFFYFNDYIVEISDNNYRFGVERGGHSGGYWFEPTITELDDKLIFSGQIDYIDSYSNNKGYKKVVNKIEEGCLFVFFSPLFLIFKLYAFIRSVIKKVRRQPVAKETTTEDRLFYLMENMLNCTRK